MIKKYIIGNKERSSEVIAELEKLGGINEQNYEGWHKDSIYFIDTTNTITCLYSENEFSKIIMECFEEIKLPEKKLIKIVTYEVASVLKDAGYPQEPCANCTVYDKEGNQAETHDLCDGFTLAPSYIEAWLWLWKVKGIRISVDYTQATDDTFDCWTKLNEEHIKELDCTSDDPELAIENTIKYLVKNNLIK